MFKYQIHLAAIYLTFLIHCFNKNSTSTFSLLKLDVSLTVHRR